MSQHSCVKNLILCFATLCMLFTSGACSSTVRNVGDIQGDSIALEHSSLLSIVECDGYTVVDVRNPWKKDLYKRYVLLPKDSVVSHTLPAGILLRVPLEHVLVFSGVHATLISELGAVDIIDGVCDAQYMYCAQVREGLNTGKVVDCGSSLNVDSERVMEVNPDAVFVLPYENGGYGKLENMKYPLVECADYMEDTPLGCAEWVRFYGRLVGKAAESDSMFFAVCSEYERLSQMVTAVEARPKLLCELKMSSAWYVPGGASTTGRLYKDSGADYFLSDNSSSGSVPLSFEYVLENAAEADIWLVKYNSPENMTLSSMLADVSGYAHFKAFRNGEVYGCNTHNRNIFEETSFHPERLLRELVSLFHPAILSGEKTGYYEKIR